MYISKNVHSKPKECIVLIYEDLDLKNDISFVVILAKCSLYSGIVCLCLV
jgi:hypothetical protein